MKIHLSFSQRHWFLPAILTGCFFFGLSWTDAVAQRSDKKPEQKNLAFIIGIDQYRGNRLPSLPAASKNGKEIAEILRQKYGYRQEQMIEMFNENATSKNITETMERLSQQLNRDDSFSRTLRLMLLKARKAIVFSCPPTATGMNLGLCFKNLI
jgi:hypothetical protein